LILVYGFCSDFCFNFLSQLSRLGLLRCPGIPLEVPAWEDGRLKEYTKLTVQSDSTLVFEKERKPSKRLGSLTYRSHVKRFLSACINFRWRARTSFLTRVWLSLFDTLTELFQGLDGFVWAGDELLALGRYSDASWGLSGRVVCDLHTSRVNISWICDCLVTRSCSLWVRWSLLRNTLASSVREGFGLLEFSLISDSPSNMLRLDQVQVILRLSLLNSSSRRTVTILYNEVWGKFVLRHSANGCELIARYSVGRAAGCLLHNVGEVYPLIPPTVSVLRGLRLGYRDLRHN